LTAAILRDDHVLLLRAALLDGDAALDAYRSWCGAVPFDAVDGNATRILPLLYRNLRRLGHADALTGRLKGLWRRVWIENNLRIDACLPVHAALADAGIPAILLKGAAMVARWVGDVGVRPMLDFDILVPRDRARAAIAATVAAGWAPHPWRVDQFDDADFAAWHGAAFRKNGYEIDMHWRPLREGTSQAGTDAFWDNAVPARLRDTEIRVPAAEEHVFHACVHGADWAAGGRIDWAADATMILRAAGDSFAWPRLAALARAHRQDVPLASLLATLRDALDVAVPRRAAAVRLAPVERLEFRLRRRPPHGLREGERTLLALQDFRRRDPRWLRRPLVAALPAFARERLQIDRTVRVPAAAAFIALGRPPSLRRVLARDPRARLLARRDLPDLALSRVALADEATLRAAPVLGWSIPEQGGRWTDGDEALLAFRATGRAVADLPIAVRLRPFADPRRRPLAVEVWVNDRQADSWGFVGGDGSLQTRGLTVSRAVLAGRPVLSLALCVREPASPAALGLSQDARRLGVFVEELRLAPDLCGGALGRKLAAHAGSPEAGMLWDGWHMPEAGGCWTAAPRAGIRLLLDAPAPGGLAVELHGRPYMPAQRPSPVVTVNAGGTRVLAHLYRPDDAPEPLRFAVPPEAVASGVLSLVLEVDPVQPAVMGEADDSRPLGFHLTHVVLQPA